MTALLILLITCITATCYGNALKPDGKAIPLAPLRQYSLLIPEKASEQTVFSARMMAEYLLKMTGINLPILQEPAESEGNIISIGETDFARLQNFERENHIAGYRIAVQNGHLLIKGGTRGPLYGVIAILEEDWGFRWYQKNEVVTIPEISGDNLDVVPRSYAPAFEMREPLYDDAMGHTEWGMFNRIQPFSYFFNIPTKMGGGMANTKYFIHTYDELIPAAKYYDSNPELFPLKNGKRFRSSQHDGQLCYTNKDLAKTMADELIAAIAGQPESLVYSISQNDNQNLNCECDSCQKIIEKDGIPGTTLLLANRVADQLSKTVPDIRITTLAYVGSQEPPKTILPSPNVAIFYAPIRERAGVLQYLPWKDIPVIMSQIDQWKKITRLLYVWDYVNTSIVPFPNFDVVEKNIQTWLDNQVTGVFLESSEFHLNSLGALKTWVFAKKLWNPTWNLDALIDEFISAYYGAAAGEIREYTAIQRNKWKEFYNSRKSGSSIFFEPHDQADMQNLLEKAYEKSPDAKIAAELCSFYAMTLKGCSKKNVNQYEQNLLRVKTLLAKHSLKMIKNDKRNIELLNRWEEQLTEVKDGDTIPVFSEDSIILKKPAICLPGIQVLPDPESYSGNSIRHISGTDWGVQWNFEKLLSSASNQAVYIARIRVKAELKQDYQDNDNAFSLHLWRSGIEGVQGRFVKFGELKSKDWQYVNLFKVYIYSPAAIGYFYNCIGEINKDEAFLYDLLEFVPIEHFKDQKLVETLPQITL